MQRTIEIKDVGNVTVNSEFNTWVKNHNVTIGGKKAELDQLLLIYAALKRINIITKSVKDGNGEPWEAPVKMISASQGLYRDKIVSVTQVVTPFMFQVTTYNILTGDNKGISDYEMETTQIPWLKRRDLVVNALKGSQVVMLNEATTDQYNYIKRKLQNMKIGCKKKKLQSDDGSVVLYDKTVFEKKDDFSDFLIDGNRQVVVAARLKHLSSSQEIVFVSLHLKSGYGDTEKRRINEFSAAIEKINIKWNDLDRVPVVVAGDLNSDYNADYSRLVEYFVPRINKPLLRNAAADVKLQEKPTYYFWHESTFDYILISPQLQVLNMKTEEVGDRAPNKDQGSDHFPVTAILGVGAIAPGGKYNCHGMKLRF